MLKFLLLLLIVLIIMEHSNLTKPPSLPGPPLDEPGSIQQPGDQLPPRPTRRRDFARVPPGESAKVPIADHLGPPALTKRNEQGEVECQGDRRFTLSRIPSPIDRTTLVRRCDVIVEHAHFVEDD